MKKLLLIVLLACGHASAAEWIIAGKRGSADFYIDALSIKESGKYRTAWIMTNLAGPRQVIAERQVQYVSSKRLRHFDCAKKTSAITEASFYADSMGQGEIVERYSTDLRSASFSRHLPGTLEEKILDVVCNVPL